MAITWRGWLSFLLGLFLSYLLFWPHSARADVSATITWAAINAGAGHPTLDAACHMQGVAAGWQVGGQGEGKGAGKGSAQFYNCSIRVYLADVDSYGLGWVVNPDSAWPEYHCPTGTTLIEPAAGATSAMCSGSRSCASIADQYSQPDSTYGPNPFDYTTEGTGPIPGDFVCLNGCRHKTGSTFCTGNGLQGDSGKWLCLGSYQATGETCTSGAPGTPVEKNTPQADCLKIGMTYGEVNGQVVCVEPGKTVKKETSKQTGDGANPGTTKKEKTTTCEGGHCTEETTETNENGGADGNQTDGSRTTKREYDEKSEEGACKTDPYSAACLGEVPTADEVENKSADVPSMLSPASVAHDFSCPPPTPIVYGLEIPWDRACELAGFIRPLVIAFAWLSAGLFVLGGLRNG